MKVTTGKIVDGRIVVEGVTFEEGSTVTILSDDECDGFELGHDEEAELLLAVEEADRGDVISAVDLLNRIRKLS